MAPGEDSIEEVTQKIAQGQGLSKEDQATRGYSKGTGKEVGLKHQSGSGNTGKKKEI